MLTQTAPAELPVGHLGLVRCASGSPLTVKQGADQDAVALEQMISVLLFKIATARASEHRGGLTTVVSRATRSTGSTVAGGPRVRIHLPPAGSPPRT
jgi:hypothetical protein